MSGEAESECGVRARPLSGGLWALLGWLRRDERATSSDSLSSAGSDRTVASFAFLAPPPPRAHAEPLPPLAAPTDSYRKRVRDGNLRRQHDRDLTLHRKYGLYYGYDAFSLPPARKNLNGFDSEQDRERRANSESLPRRAAYVPGKRRAPLPPTRPHSIASAASLTRRYNRKRPAPQPPLKYSEKSKENADFGGAGKSEISIKMYSDSDRDRRPLSDVNRPKESKSERNNSKRDIGLKDTNIKNRTEKSFLKQIFENKKRNSTIEPVPERLLPSISELDKQAAEIIESCKLKLLEQNNNSSEASISSETWFCTRCLKKYNSTVVTCQHCLPEQKRLSNICITNSKNKPSTAFKGESSTQTEKDHVKLASSSRVSGMGADEKQKLKEMLKEIKDSLPKRSKREGNDNDKTSHKNVFKFEANGRNSSSVETPTLRIGTSVSEQEKNNSHVPEPSTSKEITETSTSKEMTECSIKNIAAITKIDQILPKIKLEPTTQNVVITRHVVLVAPEEKEGSNLNTPKINDRVDISSINISITQDNKREENKVQGTSNAGSGGKNNIHTPLKISSLLNPVYIPKSNVPENQTQRSLFFTQEFTTNQNLPTDRLPAQPTASVNKTKALSSGTFALKQIPKITPAQTEMTKIMEPQDTKLKSENKSHSAPVELLLNNKQEVEKELPKAAESTTVLSSALTVTTNSILTNPAPTIASNISSKKTILIQSNMNKFKVDQHSRRRDLIKQLEQSIAKGDEKAAAEAAVKLAQLRLSCSVLSFTSQIIAGTSGGTSQPSDNTQELPKHEEGKQHSVSSPSQLSNKANVAVQSGSPNIKTKGIKVEPIQQQNSPSTSFTNVQQLNTNNNSKGEIVRKPSAEPSTSQQITNQKGGNLATIQIWVEDREATRGPVRLRISRQAVIGDLRQQAETSLGLARGLQRWIVGRVLCTDDRTPLINLAGPNLSAPFYLCVVESDNNAGAVQATAAILATNENGKLNQINEDQTSDVYSELVQLEQRALVVNVEQFECGVCMEECAAGSGAVLRECVHIFCKNCLVNLVRHCDEAVVPCPAMGCPGVLQEREIRALVAPAEYERWLARGLAAAESGTRNAFHCRTRDCTGWALCDPDVRRFPCPVCKHINCIPCQAIHEGETCEQHLSKLREVASSSTADQTDEGTRALLNTLIRKGEALECPECSAIITKKWGCDWVKCSACKTEICWVTRGRRWGPGGKGDTSDGCRCGVDGKRCHPSCGYCH